MNMLSSLSHRVNWGACTLCRSAVSFLPLERSSQGLYASRPCHYQYNKAIGLLFSTGTLSPFVMKSRRANHLFWLKGDVGSNDKFLAKNVWESHTCTLRICLDRRPTRPPFAALSSSFIILPFHIITRRSPLFGTSNDSQYIFPFIYLI